MNNPADDSDSSTYKVIITIPITTPREAEVLYEVLRVDAEPKRSYVNKQLKIIDNNKLNVIFTCNSAKNLRVGISSFFELLLLSCETLKEFGPPAESYSH